MQVQISEDIAKKLTDTLWNGWVDKGIKCRLMTWLEVNNLAKFFLQECKQQGRDYREFDFQTMLDYNLRFEENRAVIIDQLGPPLTEQEQTAANKLEDYLCDQEMQKYTDGEKSKIEQLETSNKNLNTKLNKILKAQEQQPTIDNEKLKAEIEELAKAQNLTIAKLNNLPDLDQIVKALSQSQNFKALADALKPIMEKQPEPPKKPKKEYRLPSFLHPKRQMKPLNLFASGITTLMYLAGSYGIISNFGLSWMVMLGLGGLWLSYVFVIQLVSDDLI